MRHPPSNGFAPDSDILQANDSVNGNWTYAYDALNRLASAIATGQAYTYLDDRFGNRWQQNGPHSSQPGFDANNHIVGLGVTYDAESRIATVQNTGSGTYTYAYDAAGHRISKTSGGTTVYFLYDVAGNEIAQLSSGGTWTRGEIYAGRHWATLNNATTYYDHVDWLGTERARSSATGSPYETCTSLPYGDWLTCSVSDPSPMHFTGKERDSESGLDNFGARYDSSQYGRFMSPDPLGGRLTDPQTLNKYSYVGNNPINFTDPTGLYSCRDDNNQCQTKQDIAFEKSLDSLRHSDNADVARAAGAYGAAKADNGVTVGFADLSTSGENGKTVSTIGTDANGNLRANSDVTINSKINGDSYDAAVGHEGSHAADAQDVARSGFTQDGQAIHAGMNITPYQSEVRAWGVTNSILKAGNFTQGFGCGATTCKLGASPAIGKDAILPGQIPGAIDQILANQSVYNQGGRPMGPNNQGPSVVNGVTPSASVPH